MDVFNSENEPGEDEIRRIAWDKENADILLALCEVDVDVDEGGPPYEDITLVYIEHRENFAKSFFIPNTALELGWFGYFLGKCTWLTNLSINASSMRVFELDVIELFFRGLGCNKSVLQFDMCWVDRALRVGNTTIYLEIVQERPKLR